MGIPEVLRAAIMVGGLTIATVQAAAAEGIWCARILAGEDHVTERCEFRTFEACRQAVIGEGPSFCVQSPYGPASAERTNSRRKHKSQMR